MRLELPVIERPGETPGADRRAAGARSASWPGSGTPWCWRTTTSGPRSRTSPTSWATRSASPARRRRRRPSVIIFAGVHFMAETAAILSPQKRVLLPDLEAGCSLAATITAEDVRRWKAEFPGLHRRRLRQHHGRGEGRARLLLHQRQRARRDRRHPGRQGHPLPARLLPRRPRAADAARPADRGVDGRVPRAQGHPRRDAERGARRAIRTPRCWCIPSAAAPAS